MNKQDLQSINANRGMSGTRALKNVRHLQKWAPQVFPENEPTEGFGSILPVEVLSEIHRPGGLALKGIDERSRKQLKDTRFIEVSNAAVDPLFNGTFHFVRIQFKIQNQGNAVISVSLADINTAIQYSIFAAGPISAYASLYGKNHVAVSQVIIDYAVTLPSSSYNDTQLQSWVNDIVITNNLPGNDCVIILNPVGVTNSTFGPNVTGYHSLASVPYIFSRVFGQNLTIADEGFLYAQTLSHEIAETVVDPKANDVNPEVCDACAGNCNNLWLSYFDNNGNYIETTQTFPLPAYQFYINAIVEPAFVNGGTCPIGTDREKACNYAPPRFFKPIMIAHERTAAWLIELWLLIHGGDPAPFELRGMVESIGLLATVRAISGLSKCLGDAHAENAINEALKHILGKVGGRLQEEF